MFSELRCQTPPLQQCIYCSLPCYCTPLPQPQRTHTHSRARTHTPTQRQLSWQAGCCRSMVQGFAVCSPTTMRSVCLLHNCATYLLQNCCKSSLSISRCNLKHLKMHFVCRNATKNNINKSPTCNGLLCMHIFAHEACIVSRVVACD